MNRVNIRDLGRADYRRNIQIALADWCGSDTDRFVRISHVQGLAVGFRMDGNGLDAHLLARPDYPAGDLAAVSDQNFTNFPHHKILSHKNSDLKVVTRIAFL
jgi:hypothetical protein